MKPLSLHKVHKGALILYRSQIASKKEELGVVISVSRKNGTFTIYWFLPEIFSTEQLFRLNYTLTLVTG